MILKYFDPKNDFAFKKLFGDEKHKNLCISLLNNLLRLAEGEKIEEVEFLNTVQTAEIDARKESIVDVLVSDQKGIRYIVEMQVAKIAGFEKRAQYYAAKTYCSNFKVGAKYYNLKKVIFLAFTDYIVFPKKDDYRSDHIILDSKTYEHDLKDFSFTFIELPKFKKSLEELETLEDKWCYFLKHAEETKNIDKKIENIPEMREAYEVLERTTWGEEEIYLYEKMAMNVADEQGIIDAAREDGLAEGLAAGLQQGIEKGIQEGREQGMQEGREQGVQEGMQKGREQGVQEGMQKGREQGIKEGQIQIARNLFAQGLDIQTIAKCTGLDIGELLIIQNKIN